MQIKINKFKIIQCPKCGTLQIMGGLNFNCKICNHHTKIRLKSEFGLHLKLIKSFETGLQAEKYLRQYKNKTLEKNFQGFKTYGVIEE